MNRYNRDMARWNFDEAQQSKEMDKIRSKNETYPDRLTGVSSVGYNLLSGMY